MQKISDILKEEREDQGFLISEVARSTKIKKDFLEAIEEGRFHDLPSESYALGFIKNYAKFLGISSKKAALMFRREYDVKKDNVLPTFKSKQGSFRKKILFTPRAIFILIIFISITSYIAFQYSSYFFGPELSILTPSEQQEIEGNIVEVSGETDPYASVLINGEETYVNLDGTFKKTLYLFSGDREISVVAKNRNGKDSSKMINVVVR